MEHWFYYSTGNRSSTNYILLFIYSKDASKRINNFGWPHWNPLVVKHIGFILKK